MAFDNVVYLTSGGTNYYLSGSTTTPYTGSGTPWTAENTTPYRLSLNDATPIWVPQPALAQMVYGGGPPFRSGRKPVYLSYDDVTEQVGIQMYANSADNAAALLQQLRRILNTALFTVRCILAVQTGTNTAYYEISSADVVETNSYLTEGPTTAVLIRATITWTRTPFGGRLSTGETLLSSASFTNTGTGTPDNVEAYSTGAGDLINQGQPLNVKFLGASVTGRIWLASILERKYSTQNVGAFSTTSTTGSLKCSMSFTMTNEPEDNAGIKGRVMLRLSAVSSNTQMRAIVTLFSSGSSEIYRSPWVSPPVAGATLLDMGGFSLEALRRGNMGSRLLAVDFYQRSTDGANATVTTTYQEALYYYTFCQIDKGGSTFAVSPSGVRALGFVEQTNRPCLPWTPTAIYQTNGSDLNEILNVRGTLPLYYPGASLYAAWLSGTYTHSTTDTATITATHAPLYQTLRGAG